MATDRAKQLQANAAKRRNERQGASIANVQNTTRKPVEPVSNPRASQNQASAARPTTPISVGNAAKSQLPSSVQQSTPRTGTVQRKAIDPATGLRTGDLQTERINTPMTTRAMTADEIRERDEATGVASLLERTKAGYDPEAVAQDEALRRAKTQQQIDYRYGGGQPFQTKAVDGSGLTESQKERLKGMGEAEKIAASTQFLQQNQIQEERRAFEADQAAKRGAASVQGRIIGEQEGQERQFVSPQTEAIANEFASFIAQEPTLAPYAQGISDYIRSKDATITSAIAGANSQREAQIAAAESVKGIINEFMANKESIHDLAETYAKNSRDRVQDFIKEQKEIQEDELELEAQKQARQIRENKTALIDQAIATLALSGGSGSSAGSEQLTQIKQDANDALLELEQLKGIEKRKIGANFTQQWIAAEDKYDERVLNALSKYESDISALQMSALTTENNKNIKLAEIDAKLLSDIETIRADTAKTKLGAISSMQSQILESKKSGEKAKQDAFSNLVQAFTSFAPGSTMRQFAIDQAQKAGLDTSKISINDKLSKTNEVGLDTNSLYGLFVDDATGYDVMSAIDNAVLGQGGTEAERDAQRQRMVNHLLNGRDGLFRKQLFLSAQASIEKTMPIEQSVISGQISHSQLQGVIDFYNSMTDEQKEQIDSFWGKKTRTLDKFLNNPNNEEMIEFIGKVGYFAAQKRKDLFGASLTGTEKVAAQDFLPEPGNQSLADSMKQVMVLKEQVENELVVKFGATIGSSDYAKSLLNEMVFDAGGSEYMHNVNSNAAFQEAMRNGSSGASPTFLINGKPYTFFESEEAEEVEPISEVKVNDSVVSRLISGRVTTLHDDGSPWKYGVDIAPTGGRQIVAPSDVEVVNIIDGFSNDTGKPLKNGNSQNSGFGNVAVVRLPSGHYGYISHIQNGTFKVKKGETIPAGSIIALAGNTGTTYGNTGIHVDFTVAMPDADPLLMPHEQEDKLLTNSQAAQLIGLRKIS